MVCFLGTCTCILMCRAYTIIVQTFTVIYHTLPVFPIICYMYYEHSLKIIKGINYVALEV